MQPLVFHRRRASNCHRKSRIVSQKIGLADKIGGDHGRIDDGQEGVGADGSRPRVGDRDRVGAAVGAEDIGYGEGVGGTALHQLSAVEIPVVSQWRGAAGADAEQGVAMLQNDLVGRLAGNDRRIDDGQGDHATGHAAGGAADDHVVTALVRGGDGIQNQRRESAQPHFTHRRVATVHDVEVARSVEADVTDPVESGLGGWNLIAKVTFGSRARHSGDVAVGIHLVDVVIAGGDDVIAAGDEQIAGIIHLDRGG